MCVCVSGVSGYTFIDICVNVSGYASLDICVSTSGYIFTDG